MHEIFFNSLSYGFLLDYFSSYVFPPLQCVLELLCDFFFNGTGWGGVRLIVFMRHLSRISV